MKKIIIALMLILAVDLHAKNYVWKNDGFINIVGSTALSADSKYFGECLYGSHGSIFKLWNIEKKELIFSFDSLRIQHISFTTDSKFFIYSQYESSVKKSYIKVYDIENKTLSTIDTMPSVYKMIPLNETKRLIYHYPDAKYNLFYDIYNWESKKKEKNIQLKLDSKFPNANTVFIVSNDGKKLIQTYFSPYQYRDSIPYNNIIVYDIESNQQINKIQQPERIRNLLLSPDNKNLISLGYEYSNRNFSIYLNDLNTLDSIRSFKFNLDEYQKNAYPDKVWVESDYLHLYISEFGIIKVNLTTGVRSIDLYTSEISKDLFKTSAKNYLAAYGNNLIFYSINDSMPILIENDRISFYKGNNHTAVIRAIAITNDDKHIITGGGDKSFKIWDSETGNFIYEINSYEEIQKFKLSNDNKNLIWSTFTSPSKLYLTKVEQSPSNKLLFAAKSNIIDFEILKNDDKIIIAEYGDTISVINLNDLSDIKKYYFNSQIRKIKLSHDGNILIISYANSIIKVNTSTMKMISETSSTWYAYSINFSLDDKDIAFGCSDGYARTCKTEDLSLQNTYNSRTTIGNMTITFSVIYDISFMRTNQYLIGNVGGYIKFWDYNNESSYIVYDDFYTGYSSQTRINGFAKSFNDKFIASYAENGDIVKWKMPANTSVEDELTNFSISPNPARDYIEINVGAGSKPALMIEFEIFNIFGEKITTPSNLSGLTPLLAQEGIIKLDISNLILGVYFVRVGDKFEKFVKI
jgi:WD40 repeat protein